MEKQRILCEGREKELQLCGEYIEKYNPEQSFVFILYGEGGIGKTIVTQELYRNYEEYISDRHMGIKTVYVNASGCFSIPALLLRLRMSLGDDPYDFEKFDIMYELFYDASEYVKLKRMNEFTTSENRNLAGLILDFVMNEMDKDFASLRRSTVRDPLVDFIKFTGPILDRIPIENILDWIKKSNKLKKCSGIVEEIIKSKGIFKEEKKLIELFWEAVTDTNSNPLSPFLFFIDNFQNGSLEMSQSFCFQNLDAFFELIRRFPAFWFVSSRNVLAYRADENFIEYELKGLNADAAKRIIQKTWGADKITNLENVEANILSLSNENVIEENGHQLELYSPIIIRILCQVLAKEIEKAQGNHLEQKGFEISPEIFSDVPEQSALTYYYEMGKTSVDLDCFHVLSCADIWDDYTLTVLKEKLQFYLLNTRHILAQDSMTELLGDNSIKLHDRIAEALRESANNRIRFDVYEIMYEAFLEIQQTSPILEEGVLRNFFVFSREYCRNLALGVYKYRRKEAYSSYTFFYKAFLKSIEILKERISEAMIDIYWNVVREFSAIAVKCRTKKLDEVTEAYHKLGIVVYNAGDSKKAEKIDNEFLSFAEDAEDKYGEAIASNALAVDYSANRLYGEAYKYGKRSLEVALRVIFEIAETSDTEFLERVYEIYFKYLQLPQSDEPNIEYVENHEIIIKENAEFIQRIRDIEKGNSIYKAKEIWEKMLITRGNIPWYFLEDPMLKKEKAKYSLSYGQDTYCLRRYYYGEEDSRTLQSYHNLGVYLMKYAEYCDTGDICDYSIDVRKSFSKAKEIFTKAYEIRKRVLKISLNISKEQYFQEIADKVNAEELGFLDVFDRSTIENFFEEGYDNCPAAALESLQYKSNACYLLSKKAVDLKTKDEELNEAVRLSDRIIVARSLLFGPYHRKTLESMRYSAEYYWAKGERETAEKRIRYAFGHLKENQISDEQYEEYKRMLMIITDKK